jgi:two-component system, chemotaxis family, CheB/CheR fusion protein
MKKQRRRPGVTKATEAPSRRKSSAVAKRGRQRVVGAETHCRIVAVGSSAGGLEAFSELLQRLPSDTGMAFLVTQHLDPSHKSNLPSLLARMTSMTVREANDGAPVEGNCVYVIPPNKVMRIVGRKLKLTPPQSDAEKRMAIDELFGSLAEAEGDRAVAVVLSGNGSDGTKGVEAVKAAGGTAFAQDEKSASFPLMPAHAAATGCVDFVGTPAEIGRELEALSKQTAAEAGTRAGVAKASDREKVAFDAVLALVRQRLGVDFTHYKRQTLERRIRRRMSMARTATLREYLQHLKKVPDAARELFDDFLIHVTRFFRDPPVFEVLRAKVFPRLLKGRGEGDTVRIWVPGCSSGEEVYSIAIALLEFMRMKNLHHAVQIFGTDINPAALALARSGVYPSSIANEVSAGRLRRFFVKCDDGYRIERSVRELCLFARQNVVVDPPFSNLDLISCRNLLIYLGLPLQQKVFPTFHYALKPTGFLLLGSTETTGRFGDQFYLIDQKCKIYGKRATLSRPPLSFRTNVTEAKDGPPTQADPQPAPPPTPLLEIQRQADRLVLMHFSPSGVIINRQMEVLQFRGRTGQFLEHPHGEASLNVLEMARGYLVDDLRSTVNLAIKENKRACKRNIRAPLNGHESRVNIEVIPFSVPRSSTPYYLVTFDLLPDEKTVKPSDFKATRKLRGADSIEERKLRDELATTHQSMQGIIQQHEATNEELRSANEEIMSSNEELQSTNEELETAKEELQSTNEELTTLNDELESRNSEMENVNNDLHNLMASVNIPVVMVGPDCRIRRYTNAAEELLNLIPGDVGRPITDIKLKLDLPPLDELIGEVMEKLQPREIEATDQSGHWWSLRMRPYQTTDHRIDGVVLAFVDVHALKSLADQMQRGQEFARAIVNTVSEPLVVLDQNLKITSANSAFYRTFKVSPEATMGERIYGLGNGQWDIARLRELLETILPRHSSFEDFEVIHDFPHIGKKQVRLNARQLACATEQLILLAISSVSDAK